VGVRIGEATGPRYLSLRGRILDRDSAGRPVRAVGLLLDVTTEKAMEEQLVRMSVSDGLTGAPNRRAFDQTLRGEWRRCTRAREALSIVMVDIDGFKQFNDRFGHLVGDQALISVSRALTSALPGEDDLAARYGGEEFSVVLPGTDTAGAGLVAERMLDAVRGVTVRQAPGWDVTVSVGSASWHPDRETIKANALLGRADEALYAAKRAGKNRATAYEESLAARDSLRAAIAGGLERHEFELLYQPIIGLADGGVTGFEALMRWNRPGHGVVTPAGFIEVAQTTSLICDLDRWALHEATGQLASWRRSGLNDSHGRTSAWRMAVNVSCRHAATEAIVTDVEAALTAAGIAPAELELELTETALTGDVVGGPHLAAVRALGVAVAIDDFGTGETSIRELARMPVDAVKLDPAFTGSTSPHTATLLKLIIEASHAFGLRVVGEGVEHGDALQTLRARGCDTAQGYLLGRPMPAGEVPGWLANRAR
jgi:diguanylate cyclase (GGDEF)-like protein